MDTVMFVIVNAIHVPQKLRGESHAEYRVRRAMSKRLCRMVPEVRERALVAEMRDRSGYHEVGLFNDVIGTLFEEEPKREYVLPKPWVRRRLKREWRRVNRVDARPQNEALGAES